MPWASSFRGGPICTCLVRGLFGARASPAVSGARRGEEVDSIVGESSCARRRVDRRSPVVVLSFFLLKTIPTFSLIQLLNQESWVLGFGAVSSVKVRLTQLPNLRDRVRDRIVVGIVPASRHILHPNSLAYQVQETGGRRTHKLSTRTVTTLFDFFLLTHRGTRPSRMPSRMRRYRSPLSLLSL